ncbi:hypothetical protein ACT8ZV_06160 [Nocardioides sp. MAHUQ-72]|uniref:hypothetical protein n=1 Tax=unclassified Nocardioides TaxID=2615069 RepID=UPI00360CD56D
MPGDHLHDPRTPGPASAPPLPRRPALRPGLHVVRRDDRHLQVGIDPPHVLVLPDEPLTRRLLEELRAGVTPDLAAPAARRLVADLAARGLVVDGAVRDATLGAAEDRGAAAAAFAQFGDDAARRLADRDRARVRVEAAPDTEQAATRLLRASGVGLAAVTDEPTAVLVVCDEALPRARVDPLVRAGLPHLVVAPASGGVVVGPFVVPGLTACLRCVDAARAERDPRRPVLLEQCHRGTAVAGPTPRDPSLHAVAVGLAVRDLVSFVDGDRPATWSATVTVGPDLALARQAWRRHVHCGCAWDELLAV